MEKKLPPRQSPAQPKNNGVISEKKSDYTTSRNGRQRKYKPASNAGRSLEVSQNPKPLQKYTQSYGDKRPRQRSYFNDRQGEEVVEVGDDLFVADDTNSRKGNANYLLKFSFSPRGESGRYDSSRGSAGRFGRGGYWQRRKTPAPRYSPEQFLQASCQFIVSEGGEYTEQAINPDALVNWDLVEQVRTFSEEPIVCPICLETPCAGKITKCGHVYCWSCILHHLQEKELMSQKQECPICPHKIDPEELKSVLCVETTNYKVGDIIEMKLMRKSKGSVYVCPKPEWTDKEGVPHNIEDGTITQYMKLLSATCDQIKEQVIKKEKLELDDLLQKAEGYETCYIQIAKDCLEKRESMLQMKRQLHTMSEMGSFVRLADPEVELPKVPKVESNVGAGTEVTITYADAFENQEKTMSQSESASGQASLPGDDDDVVSNDEALPAAAVGKEQLSEDFLEDTCPPGLVLPLMSQPYSCTGHLTPEEAADHLELPEGGGLSLSLQRDSSQTKDTYYFYQASTGQHIYLNSLNAQCLTKEYGSLENSPEVLEAHIVAIERIFMNEDVRKRLRYLNHIPLTCEFHVVELRFQPPLISRETLQHFQPEFDKRRKARLRKKKEEKERARQQEVAHKASFGIYPEVQIPLDNLTQFPAHLGSSSTASLPATGSEQSEPISVRGSSWSGSGSDTLASSPGSPRQRNDSEESQTGLMSFAQMLKAGKSTPQKTVWGRVAPTQDQPLHTSSTMPELRSPTGRYDRPADDDDGGEYLPAPPISSSWFDDISKAMDAHVTRQQAQEATEGPASTVGGGKKKKKKEKQLLFSTSMARKG